MIEVEIFGDQQVPKHRSNISGYSYSEEATPVSPSDSSGGVGAISFETRDEEEISSLVYKDEVYLRDSHNGEISGRVNSISANDGVVSFSGTSNLARLNIVKSIPAMEDTLGNYLEFLFNTAGIFSGIDIDEDIAAVEIVAPAFEGDLWVYFKDLCTVYDFEVALVKDTIYVRKIRQNLVKPLEIVTEGWSIADVNPAQYVEVNYYNYVYEDSFLVYPKGGWSSDVQVYQVDAGQTLTIELPVDAYLEDVVQPAIQNFVPRDEIDDSVYCIAGKDGLPVDAALWADNGGSLSVSIAEGSNKLIVEVTGAILPDLGPFRIGVSAGPSDYYSSLRIMGTGVSYDLETLRHPTGLTEDNTSNEVGITIDNKFISTKEQARDAAKRASIFYGLPTQTYNFSAPNLGQFLEVPVVTLYTHFWEYDNSLAAGEVFSTLDESLDDWSFSNFDSRLPAVQVQNDVVQLFGNVAGARIRFRDNMYRIRSATIEPTQVSAETQWDTLMEDFNNVNVDETFESFNSGFDNMTFTDFSVIPLRSF
jgi:hypothetical protein